MITSEIQATLEQAGCAGTLYVQSLDQEADIGLGADEPVTPGSVVKVQIALETETWFADGRLDRAEPVTLAAAAAISRAIGTATAQAVTALRRAGT